MTEHETETKLKTLRLSKDPLIHFFIIAVLLIFANWIASVFSAPPTQILVTSSTQQKLIETWTASVGRAPDEKEIDDLIKTHVQDEVVFREAMKRGLDEGDTIIRRRLIQKFEFLSNDITVPKTPDEQALKDWYDAHQKRFAVPARRSLIHIFFATNDPDNEPIKTALARLKNLENSIDPKAWLNIGDAFPVEQSLTDITLDDLSSDFGSDFAEASFAAPLGEWSGPFRSAFGHHLVFVTQEQVAFTPEFKAIRDQLLGAWRREERLNRRQRLIDELTAEYEIVIEGNQP